MGINTKARSAVKRTPAKNTRGAARREAPGNETAQDRFEFARRHVLHQQRLETVLDQARDALWRWTHYTAEGFYINQPLHGKKILRKARTPEERLELKALEAAVVDARARLLLHENDGQLL